MSNSPEVFRIRVAARRQVTLPEELLELLRIDEGDTLEIRVDKNMISGGYGLKLVPTSLFDDELMVRLREREKEIAQGTGIAAKNADELVGRLERRSVSTNA